MIEIVVTNSMQLDPTVASKALLRRATGEPAMEHERSALDHAECDELAMMMSLYRICSPPLL